LNLRIGFGIFLLSLILESQEEILEELRRKEVKRIPPKQVVREDVAVKPETTQVMPLVIIVGWPCSGKTTISKEIVDFFEKDGKPCQLVSDQEILSTLGRNKVYSG